MPSVVLTGATGYIGGRLAASLLSRGIKVIAVVRSDSRPVSRALISHPGLTVIPSEDGLAERLSDHQPEVLFHLASHTDTKRSAENSHKMLTGNVLYPIHVLEAALAAGCRRLVNAGTQSQYRDGTADYVPTDLYAASKQAFEDLVRAYVEYDGIDAVSLILSDVYGPHDTRGRLLSLLIAAQRSGSPIELTPGHQEIDLVHVDDVVNAFEQAGESLSSGLALDRHYAVRSGRSLTLRQLVEVVERIGGRSIDARWGARPYRPGTIMHPWRGAQLPGWQSSISLEKGLRTLMADQAHQGTG